LRRELEGDLRHAAELDDLADDMRELREAVSS
jgi:hypothetical protein